MKLEVGQFARLKNGYIVKILNVKDEWIETDTKFITRTFPQDFAKASYNIIDILKVGDYVNGKEVTDKFDYLLSFGNNDYYLNKEDIKTIITKEQMEQMAYKVGE